MNLHEPSAAVAFGLGLWTAVQPCPMTSNVAVVAWLGRRAGSIPQGVFAVLLFVLGQTLAFVVLAWLVLAGVASSWRLSIFLQQHVNEFLGPMWIFIGMVLLGLIDFRLPRLAWSASHLPDGEGTIRVWTAFPLGVMLALAFCPVTAVLFFVNLVTIATTNGSHVLYPTVYALGAAMPVAAFALLFSAGSRWLGIAFRRTQQVQSWLNRATGAVVLLVGIYYALRFNFALLPW